MSWDPISVFAICWILDIGMPDSRLTVKEVIENREQIIIVESISRDVTLREDCGIKN